MVRESKVDWFTVLLYIIMIVTGWFNLYSIGFDDNPSPWSMDSPHGRQLIFISAALAIGIVILILDTKFLEFISYILFGISILLLITTMFLPETRNTSSFINLWGFGIQPTEFAKFSTIMALAKYMSRYNFSMLLVQDVLICGAIVLAPMVLILAQNDAGSALVFPGLILIFFREGLHPLIMLGLFMLAAVLVLTVLFAHSLAAALLLIILVVLVVAAVWFFVSQRKFLLVHLIAMFVMIATVLGGNFFIQPHQSSRFRVLITPEEKMSPGDKDTYYNLRESLVAIGSGGPTGKGFGKATHTRGDFVPEEHTDYIFCVISEEHGFLGAAILLLLFLVLLWRILHMAENSKTRYARIYGYGAASVIFMHVMINIGMTIGLLPTIGIPLVFYSYGGSSMIAFSLMLFILMNHYSYRTNILQ